MNFFN